MIAAVIDNRASDRRAGGIVLVERLAKAALSSSVLGGACACATSDKRAVHSCCVIVAVIASCTGYLSAARIIFVLGCTLVACGSAVTRGACACATTDKRAVHSCCVIVAVQRNGTGYLSAAWIIFVLGCTLVACGSAVNRGARTCATTDKRAVHSCCVIVAVQRNRTGYLSAAWVVFVLICTLVARGSAET